MFINALEQVVSIAEKMANDVCFFYTISLLNFTERAVFFFSFAASEISVTNSHHTDERLRRNWECYFIKYIYTCIFKFKLYYIYRLASHRRILILASRASIATGRHDFYKHMCGEGELIICILYHLYIILDFLVRGFYLCIFAIFGRVLKIPHIIRRWQGAVLILH